MEPAPPVTALLCRVLRTLGPRLMPYLLPPAHVTGKKRRRVHVKWCELAPMRALVLVCKEGTRSLLEQCHPIWCWWWYERTLHAGVPRRDCLRPVANLYMRQFVRDARARRIQAKGAVLRSCREVLGRTYDIPRLTAREEYRLLVHARHKNLNAAAKRVRDAARHRGMLLRRIESALQEGIVSARHRHRDALTTTRDMERTIRGVVRDVGECGGDDWLRFGAEEPAAMRNWHVRGPSPPPCGYVRRFSHELRYQYEVGAITDADVVWLDPRYKCRVGALPRARCPANPFDEANVHDFVLRQDIALARRRAAELRAGVLREAGAADLGLGRERDACQERLDEAVAQLRRHEARVRAFIDLTSSAGGATKKEQEAGSPRGLQKVLTPC